MKKNELKDYKFIKQIGKGATSRVYEIRDKYDTRFALKEIGICSKESIETVCNEKSMPDLKHDNILKYELLYVSKRPNSIKVIVNNQCAESRPGSTINYDYIKSNLLDYQNKFNNNELNKKDKVGMLEKIEILPDDYKILPSFKNKYEKSKNKKSVTEKVTCKFLKDITKYKPQNSKSIQGKIKLKNERILKVKKLANYWRKNQDTKILRFNYKHRTETLINKEYDIVVQDYFINKKYRIIYLKKLKKLLDFILSSYKKKLKIYRYKYRCRNTGFCILIINHSDYVYEIIAKINIYFNRIKKQKKILGSISSNYNAVASYKIYEKHNLCIKINYIVLYLIKYYYHLYVMIVKLKNNLERIVINKIYSKSVHPEKMKSIKKESKVLMCKNPTKIKEKYYFYLKTELCDFSLRDLIDARNNFQDFLILNKKNDIDLRKLSHDDKFNDKNESLHCSTSYDDIEDLHKIFGSKKSENGFLKTSKSDKLKFNNKTKLKSVHLKKEISEFIADHQEIIITETLASDEIITVKDSFGIAKRIPYSLISEALDLNKSRKLYLKIFRNILQGLEYLHSCNIFHNDLSCSNIFFDSNLNPKIGDFGMINNTKMTNMDKIKNPKNLSFEMLNNDLKSLGSIFFQLIWPMKTVMERAKTLEKILETRQLPDEFVYLNKKESIFIEMCLFDCQITSINTSMLLKSFNELFISEI